MNSENVLKSELQKKYLDYVTKKIVEASKNNLTCRISINIRAGWIESLQDIQNIAGETIANYFLDNKSEI
jgi:hypothetical protein